MKKKEESTRFLAEITFGTDHYLANLLALRKLLNIPLAEAKLICKSKPGELVHLFPFVKFESKLSTDELIEELEEYDIKIKVINQ